MPAAERADFFARCREIGAPADAAAYEEGRAEGLAAYCTVEGGYEAGRAGRRYRDVCPAELEVGFLQGFEQGRKDLRRDDRYSSRFGFGVGFGRYPGSSWWVGRRYRHDPFWPWWP